MTKYCKNHGFGALSTFNVRKGIQSNNLLLTVGYFHGSILPIDCWKDNKCTIWFKSFLFFVYNTKMDFFKQIWSTIKKNSILVLNKFGFSVKLNCFPINIHI
jgi:hypothetical protein